MVDAIREFAFEVCNGWGEASEHLEAVPREFIAKIPIPATCAHAWEPAKPESLAPFGVTVDRIPPGGEWCPLCKSLRRPSRDAALPADLSPVERVTHVVCRELAYAAPILNAPAEAIVYGLLLVAADLYVQQTAKNLRPGERKGEFAIVCGKALNDAEDSVRPRLSIVH